jgi:hypothetical protein
MKSILFLIFITFAFAYKQTPATCNKPVKPACENPLTCSKTPILYCLPNVIQKDTNCICNRDFTVKLTNIDGTFVCTDKMVQCNSTTPDVCCGNNNTYFSLSPGVGKCSPKYPLNVNNTYNSSFTCNSTDGTNYCLIALDGTQTNLTASCAIAQQNANPNAYPTILTQECCTSPYQIRDINGVCGCSDDYLGPCLGLTPLPECSNPNGCNTVFHDNLNVRCVCKPNQNVTYTCGGYTCTDLCTPSGQLIHVNQSDPYTCNCIKNLRCPPGSDGYDETCTEKYLNKVRCYTNGTNYVNVRGDNCDCNLTKLSDEPCPTPCLSPSQYCDQMEGFPYPRCPQYGNCTKGDRCKSKQCGTHSCNMCSQVTAPSGTLCRDVRLNGKCIAYFYRVCNGCEYPGPEIVCPVV